jgi:hypothetical protein
MTPIQKDELFGHLSGFLKDKGIELKEGSYSNGIRKSCGILADMINLGQHGLKRAKTELDHQADQLRQVIHEKTAPKTAPKPASASPEPPKTPPKAKKTPKSAPRKKGSGRK